MTSDGLAGRVLAGDRRSLARAITLVESTRPADRQASLRLLDEVLPSTGAAVRVAVTGAPGAGKSTLIEALGLHLIAAGRRVAVLAVDPSSVRGGGSVLGDKTRMEALAREAGSFIRPSPAAGSLGGVARRTREAMLLCEAAGHDVVLVETVGVGQSEIAVSSMVDVMVLVAAPGGGDELQGIKRGIMEFADVVVVNKADGAMRPAANQAASDLRRAMHLLRGRHPGWEREVVLASAIDGSGVPEVWETVERLHQQLSSSGQLQALRQGQAVEWMWDEVRQSLLGEARARLGDVRDVVDAVREGRVAATSAAQHLLEHLGQAQGAPE